MSKRLVTVRLRPAEARLDSVRASLGLAEEDVDAGFGVVSLDPQRDLYAILVEERAAERLAGSGGVVGVHANPKIEAFGPPKKRG